MKEIEEMFGLAERHKDFDRRFYNKVMNQDPNLVKSYATPEAKKLYKMHSSVARCMHLKRSFMRLEYSKKGILYAKTKLEHHVIDMILNHFKSRFPLFYIAIEVSGKTYVIDEKWNIIIHDLDVKSVVKKLEKELPDNILLEDIDPNNNLWGEYYDSQYISERRNLKLMKHMMPLKYRDENDVETRLAKRCCSLKDFI